MLLTYVEKAFIIYLHLVAKQIGMSKTRVLLIPMQNREKGDEKMKSNDKIPGKGAATASMVLGIISVVLWFFGYSALVSVILGIVGLILAGNAKKAGFVGGIQTAGFVLSLIGLIGGAIFFVACIACVGAIGAAGTSDAFSSLFNNM